MTKITRQLNRPLFDSYFIKRALKNMPPIEGEKFVSALVTASTMSVFSPGDRPPARRLFIIMHGVALLRNEMLGIGDCWGDIDVLLELPAPPAREAKAVTYLRVIWIKRDDFRQLEVDFPGAFRALRSVAIFKRARRIMKVWRQEQKSGRYQPIQSNAMVTPSPVEFKIDSQEATQQLTKEQLWQAAKEAARDAAREAIRDELGVVRRERDDMKALCERLTAERDELKVQLQTPRIRRASRLSASPAGIRTAGDVSRSQFV